MVTKSGPDQKTTAYDASAVKNPESLENQQMPHRVATVRSERGYSATNYDATVVNLPKPSRGQFGQKHDDKKVRNTCGPGHASNVKLVPRQLKSEAHALLWVAFWNITGPSLVIRESAPRWARRLGVQSDVGELSLGS